MEVQPCPHLLQLRPRRSLLLKGHGPSVKRYQLLPEPDGCWTRPDSGLAPDRRPGQGDVSPGLRCGP